MSTERTNVIGIVILTMLITTVVIGAGWFGASRYLSQQQTATAPHEEAQAAPAPRRKARAAKSDSARGGPQETRSPNDPAPAAASDVPERDTARAPTETDPSSAAGRGSAVPAPEAAPSSGREEGESAAVAPIVAAAPAAGNRGEARTIMEESQRRTDASSYQYEGLLQSFDAKNKVTEKRWLFDRAGSHGRSKSVLRFTSPPEVKGVALLIGNHPDRASDQWMWTPAIERDRRIALQDRSTRFFGTDFSFEDLEERDVDQYDYSMLGNEPIEGADCWKIALTPKQGRSSQYSRGIAWVRKDNYAFARLDNFVKDDVVKRLTYSTLENIQGIWTARQLEMSDLHRGSRTRLTLQQVRYNVPTRDEDFTLQAIRR
jgi:hypothetical protein